MVNDLCFVAPERQGLSSNHVLRFIELMEKRKVNLHSFLIYRRGDILAEGYCKPFDKDFKHRLYSSSKTVVSLAIGKMVGEKRISLDDTLEKYFPEYVNDTTNKWLKECTIEDTLKMAVPMRSTTYGQEDSDWVQTCFSQQAKAACIKPAGTVFSYNTSATFLLCVLIKKLTGKDFLEYLRPEFDKIGVSKDVWCVKSPDGYEWGGSGVVITMRDFAKIGELVLHKGKYNGEQLIPQEYMEKATSKQISNILVGDFSSLRTYGYGYQIWINEKGYSLQGLAGQYVFCFPDKDFMFVCNGDIASSVGDYLYESVCNVLYENIQQDALPTNEKAYNRLQDKLNNLEFIKGFGEKHSDFEKEVSGVTYELEKNDMGWKWLRFDFQGETGTLTYENAGGVKSIPFGCGEFVEATFPETHYYDRTIGVPADRGLQARFIAEWTEEKKVLLRAYIIDTNFANLFMTFGFKGDEVGCMFWTRAEMCLEKYTGFAGGRVKK